MLLLFTGGSGSGPAAASYPLDDDGTLAAAFGLGWLETDATAYNNADYTYTGAATGNSVVALPTAANAWTSQAIVVDTGTILACEAVINSVSAAEFANLGVAAAASSGGTPSGVVVINSIANNGAPQWIVSGTGGTRTRSGATSGYRVGIELNGNDGTITMRSSDGSALCSTTFTPGVAFTFYLFATDAGNPAAGQTASITLVPVGADMQLGYSAGTTDYNGDPCPEAPLATFNPAKLGATGQLSNGNLTLSDSATGAWATCLATIGRTAGTGSVEFTFSTSVNFYVMVGAATASVGLNSFAGADALGYGDFGPAGVLYHDSSSSAATTFNSTDVVTVGYDFSAKTMAISVNGGTPDSYSISALSGAIYAAASVCTESGSGSSTHINMNAGQSAFTYPIAGYPEGL